MKIIYTILALAISFRLGTADRVPGLVGAPTEENVKPLIAPPPEASLYDVFYAKGTRVYVCNPEKTGFQHWYNVQTHAELYPTRDEEPPFDKPGNQIALMSVAPLNQTQQMASPMTTYPVIMYYPDGSWVGTDHPLKTTSREPGRAERGDGANIDDHIERAAYTSTNGYLSHARYVVRLNSLNGQVPSHASCVTKGTLESRPFEAFFMFYTDEQGFSELNREQEIWQKMVAGDFTQ
ncbi:hypothetical protein J3Q64DRAFT_1724276 [Phycomyces blakesleeanus]|uniref:Secreted protein n=1 Tax=Phycomyces blakesleeanus TaxID=4837 RepID=A0ABR3B6E2_PHYBL